MARIELKHCEILFRDGLAGVAVINQPVTPPAADDTTLTVDGIVLNTLDTEKIPVGARFTIAGETDATAIHVVTARTPTSGSPTTAITIAPALGPGTYADNAALTFLPQQIDITVGDGNVTYSEKTAYTYDLDRGLLDTVREGNETPMDVKLECIYAYITTGTAELDSPMDALKGIGAASEWVSAATDKCEPYAIDVVIVHTPPCGTMQVETTTFPDFRSESRDIDFQKANIAITGKCNAVEPIVTRG